MFVHRMLKQEFQARVDSYTTEDLQIYYRIAEAIVELCEDAGSNDSEERCQTARNLQAAVTSFVVFPTIDNYFQLMLELVSDFILEYNPWTAIFMDEDEELYLRSQGPQTKIRGGVESNTTVKFNILGIDYLNTVQTIALNITTSSGGNPFTEYIFVSDGQAASAAALTAYTASQLYKNRDATGATRKVTLVGYGGTGDPSDMTLAAIPASVQGVNLQNPIMGDAASSM